MKNLVALALSLLAVGCANYMRVEVEGRVVDEAGRPVPNAEVTTAPWYDVKDAPKLRTFIRTDKEGRFSATLPRSMAGRQAVFAVLADETKGGFTAFPGNKAADLRIVVQPLFPVRAEIDVSQIPAPFRMGPQVYASSAPPRDALIATCAWNTNPRAVSFRLPAGSYSLTAIGAGKPVSRTFEVTDREVDLGAIELEPYKYQTLFDREAPALHIADARGVSKDFKLSDLRGKWVVLFFWNHRMELNRHMLESLAGFYSNGEKMRDRFEVLVIHHSDDVLSVRDLDMALWRKDVRLPMPVIIDDGEKTFEAYGLERGPMFRSAPTEFLVDPEGKIVSHGFAVLPHLLASLMNLKLEEK